MWKYLRRNLVTTMMSNWQKSAEKNFFLWRSNSSNGTLPNIAIFLGICPTAKRPPFTENLSRIHPGSWMDEWENICIHCNEKVIPEIRLYWQIEKEETYAPTKQLRNTEHSTAVHHFFSRFALSSAFTKFEGKKR